MKVRVFRNVAMFVMTGAFPAVHAQLIGLPASDVLGSEDIWANPTFVGGVIDGGPTASSQY